MATRDYEWYVDSDLSQYRGKYVIILNEKVIYYGKDLTELLRRFREEYPSQIPKIAKIPEEETLILEC